MGRATDDSQETALNPEKGLRDYRAWMENLPYAVVVLDQGNTLVYANAAFTRITGYTLKEVIGKKPPFPFWPREKQDQYLADLQRQRLHSNRLLKKKKGDSFWAEVSLSQIESKNQPPHRLLTFQDVSEQKQTRENYRRARAERDEILDAIPIPISIASLEDMTFTQVNSAFEQSSGFTRQEIIGRKTNDLPWTDNQVGGQRPANLIKPGSIGDVELHLTSKTGEERTAILKTGKAQLGDKEYMVAASIDITDRKKAEEEARRLLIQQQAILDNIPDMAWLKDDQLRFIAANKALVNNAARPIEEIIGQTDFELFPNELAKKYLADDSYVIEKGIGVTVEDPIPAPGGGTQWVETSKIPLFNEQGEVVGLAGIARDVTGRKKAQFEVQELNRVLRAIREVNRIITHEKDPRVIMESACRSLTAIRGYESCWMAQLDDNLKLKFVAESNMGEYFTTKREVMRAGNLPNCARQALIQGKAVILQENDEICRKCLTFSVIRSNSKVLVVPIQHSGKIQGVLSVVARPTINVDAEEIQLLEEMAADIGLALYDIELEKQRVKAEVELKISEERFRMISEVAQDMIYRVNLIPDMVIDYLSPSFTHILGYAADEITENIKKFISFVHPDDRAVMADQIIKLESSYSQPFVIRWRHKSGHYIYIEHRNSAIKNESGEVITMVGIGRDITQRIRMEESLIESENFSQRLLEESPNPVVVIDDDRSIRFANQALINLTGFSKEELVDRKPPYPWWPKNAIKENQKISLQNHNLDRVEQERVFQKKNGELFLASVSVRKIADAGKAAYFLSTWIDITEQREAEEALRESEAYATGLLRNAPNPILVTNIDSSIKYMNPAMERITGYSTAELIGVKTPYPWWPAELKEQFINEDTRDRYSTWPTQVERRYQKKNGEYYWVFVSISSIREETGEVKYFVANWVDITERKQAEQALQASEEKTRLIFTSIADGVLITDLQGNIIDCNDSTVQLAGVSKPELIGKSVAQFVIPEDRSRAFEFIQKTIVEGHSGHIRYTAVKPDGKTFPVDTISNIARDKAGNPLYLVVSFQDITERKEMEDRIIDLYEKEKKQREELQEEARTRGMFIDVLAHELRTPLTPILASTGMLQDLLGASEEPILQKLCTNIADGAETLAHRLEELLDVARHARGVFHLNRLPIKLLPFVNEVIDRFKPTMDQRHQKLVTEVADNLPLAEVDSSRMEQVIINLLSNASKFSLEKGKIYFKAAYEDETLKIEVRDEGIGISEDEQSRLFQPYHRVEQDRQRFPGLGLGLTVAKQIVEAHGGNIRVSSHLGSGSTFTVTIPLKEYEA